MNLPKILIVHNRYQHRGGEDTVVEAEVKLLSDHGHRVRTLFFDNQSIRGPAGSLAAGVSAVWSRRAQDVLRATLKEESSDIVHFHNTFPLVSPAAYHVCRSSGSSVVQTLHNFRVVCANGLLLRNQQPCVDCVGRTIQWPGVAHGCYRGPIASMPVVLSNAIHGMLGTWLTQVDRYIALSRFAKRTFVAGGLPADRIAVKPNFAPMQSRSLKHNPATFVYAGRLSPEKGVATLLSAFIGRPEMELIVCGDGPLSSEVTKAAAEWPNIRWRGHLDANELRDAMRLATALLVPSHCYEGFPVVVAEAFSHGLPVIASAIGGLPEIVEAGRTGLLVPAGDPFYLAEAAGQLGKDPELRERLSRGAFNQFLELYSPQKNYALLRGIYDEAVQTRAAHP